jgi:hypothetical protein
MGEESRDERKGDLARFCLLEMEEMFGLANLGE